MAAAPIKIVVRVIALTAIACAGVAWLGWRAWSGSWESGAALASLSTIGAYIAWLYVPDFDLPGRSPRRGHASDGVRVALTFDDGPNGAHTSAILDALKRHDARATFFVVGEAVRRHPDLVRRMVEEGHVIGSHTDGHTKLPWLSKAEVEHELDAAHDAIVAAGAPAPRWFRAPHGFKSPFLPRALRQRDMKLVAWTHGVWDTDRPGAEVIAGRAIGCLADREILLLHDGTLGADRSQTAAALQRILVAARARGVRFVTVPEILSEAA
jgi:peptidoglycan/xylan/chitin deacetylase (PgdA/CDA1 family)